MKNGQPSPADEVTCTDGCRARYPTNELCSEGGLCARTYDDGSLPFLWGELDNDDDSPPVMASGDRGGDTNLSKCINLFGSRLDVCFRHTLLVTRAHIHTNTNTNARIHTRWYIHTHTRPQRLARDQARRLYHWCDRRLAALVAGSRRCFCCCCCCCWLLLPLDAVAAPRPLPVVRGRQFWFRERARASTLQIPPRPARVQQRALVFVVSQPGWRVNWVLYYAVPLRRWLSADIHTHAHTRAYKHTDTDIVIVDPVYGSAGWLAPFAILVTHP